MLFIKSLLSKGENKTDLIHLFVNFLKKYEKMFLIMNDRVLTWTIEDGVSLLQLLSCNQNLQSLHASKSSVKVAIVAKEADFLMFLIYSYSTCEISKEWVLNYDNNSYANIGTVCTYLGNTISRNISQYHVITGCDTASFFYRNGKINPIKEVRKKSRCFSLIKCSVKISLRVTQILKIL